LQRIVEVLECYLVFVNNPRGAIIQSRPRPVSDKNHVPFREM